MNADETWPILPKEALNCDTCIQYDVRAAARFCPGLGKGEMPAQGDQQMTESHHSFRSSVPIAVACFFVAFAGGCPFPLGETLVLDKNDSGGTVAVRAGDSLSVTLYGNMSTGYAWQIADLDETVMEHIDTTYCGCLIPTFGCGEFGTWTLTALSASSAAPRMVYHQPWTDVAPTRTFDLTVAVTNS